MSICKGCGAELSATTGFLHDCSRDEAPKAYSEILGELATRELPPQIGEYATAGKFLHVHLTFVEHFAKVVPTDVRAFGLTSSTVRLDLEAIIFAAALALAAIESGGS